MATKKTTTGTKSLAPTQPSGSGLAELLRSAPKAQLAAALDAAALAPVTAPVKAVKESAAEKALQAELAGGLEQRLGAARVAPPPSRVPELLAKLGEPDTRAGLERCLTSALAPYGGAEFVEKALLELCRQRGVDPDAAASPLAALKAAGGGEGE